jgi:hypothetical protein
MGHYSDLMEEDDRRQRAADAERREQKGNEVLKRTRVLFHGVGMLDRHIDMKVAELEGLILRYIRGG